MYHYGALIHEKPAICLPKGGFFNDINPLRGFMISAVADDIPCGYDIRLRAYRWIYIISYTERSEVYIMLAKQVYHTA